MTAPRLTVAIMGVPERAEAWARLVLRLCLEDQPVRVALDTDVNGLWATDTRARTIWGADTGEWHLVLQDDAILTSDFVPKLHALLDVVPRGPLALFSRHDAIHAALGAHLLGKWGKPYVQIPACDWFGAVALAMPRELQAEGIEWVNAQDKGQFPRWAYHDDERWASFFHAKGLPVTLSTPCLVEHDDDLPSMVGHRHGRVASWFEP